MANGVNDLTGGLPAVAQPTGGLSAALTPEQIAELQASAALMQQRIQAASDPNRNAAFDKYVADQAAKGVEVASTYTGGGGPLGSGGVLGVTDFAPAFDPARPGGTTGQVVRFDPERMNAPVVFQPGQQYVLTDASGENVIGRASSVEELQKLAAAKESMPYGFQLYRADEQGQYQPGTQLFGETDPRTKGLMGALVNYGLPIAAGIATGGLSFLPAVAASAAASGASKLMTGYTPEDAAKSAAIAAATRGVLKGTGLEDSLGTLLSAKGSAAGNVVGNAVNPGFYVPGTVIPKFVAPTLSGLGGTFGSLAAAPVAGEILVQGTRNVVNPALTSAITGGLSTLTPAVFDPGSIPQFQSPDVSNAETQLGDDELVVTGNRIRITPPDATLPIVPFDPSVIPRVDVPRVEPPTVDAESDDDELVVTGDRIRITPPGTTLPIIPFDPSVIPQTNVPRVEPPPTDAESDDDEIVVTGKKVPPPVLPPTTITFPDAPFYVPPTIIPPQPPPPTVDNTKPKDTLDKIADVATIAGLVIPAIGALAGDGKGGGTGTYIPGGGSFDPIFSAKLPTPGEGGAFTVGGLGPATGPNPLAVRPTADWYRYAMGPAMDMPAGVDLSAATSPYAGFGPGTLGLEAFNRVTGRAGSEVAPRPTGDLPSRRVGETTVVDGDTYVWGGNQNGWQRQYKDPATGDTKLFSGATNVTSLADMLASGMATQRPANQPYFKQNLTNIPDWANTYRNWQTAMRGAGVPEAERFAAEREFMTALEQRPFGNAKELFDFARGLLDRSRRPKAAARGGPMGYARGSSRDSFAVEGPGTGRSDDIPAVLSDGEYVIDAETVALLGDGSSRAGAKKLDELRVKVRKHKGKNLAKGKFSVNAKHPEAYMRGGRI